MEQKKKNAVRSIVLLCFKCLASRAAHRQPIAAAGASDHIRVEGKRCSPWFVISFQPLKG